MSYKTEFQSNNADLQTILDVINTIDGGSAVTNTFTPTDSGGDTYKSKFQDNNADLQIILEVVNKIPAKPTPIPVTITGKGLNSYTYTTINGKNYANAATGIEVMPGDTITFATYGSNYGTGTITINKSVKASITGFKSTTYNWKVPTKTKTINIELMHDLDYSYGTINVTTTT